MQMKSDTMTAEQKVQCVIGTMQIEGFEVTDKTRELLMYDGNEELIENKFKDNAFGRYGKYYSNLIPKNENIDEHLTVFNEILTC